MTDNEGRRPIRVVVAGGGTAGWVTATALVRQLGSLIDLTLVESEEIGTIGVGESTVPTARAFHEFLKIDQQAFMRASRATFKLGISFENWAREGDRYIHSFGTMPLRTWTTEFQHFWLEARARGEADDIGAYYLEHEAARLHRMDFAGIPSSTMPSMSTPASTRASCARSPRQTAARARKARSPASSSMARAAISPHSSWRTGPVSRATCSSIAPASAPCCSARRSRRRSRTGCTGCPMTVPGRRRWKAPARPIPIRAPLPTAPAGSGASRSSIAWAPASSSRAIISNADEARTEFHASMEGRAASRSASSSSSGAGAVAVPGSSNCIGIGLAAISSSRWNRPPFTSS
jgi:hypothetical protein